MQAILELDRPWVPIPSDCVSRMDDRCSASDLKTLKSGSECILDAGICSISPTDASKAMQFAADVAKCVSSIATVKCKVAGAASF